MSWIPAGSLAAKVAGLMAVSLCLGMGVPALLAISGPSSAPVAAPASLLGPLPSGIPPVSAPHDPALPSPPSASVSALNGSPFLGVDAPSGGYAVDDSLLPEEYANPNGSAWVDSYVLQADPNAAHGRVALQVTEPGDYSTAIDSVALGLVAPGSGSVYTEEGSSSILGVASSVPVLSAHDGAGQNVTSLLGDPGANASTPSSSYFEGTSGETVLAGFGSVASADQDVLLLRSAQDPIFPPPLPSGITVQVQDPASGAFSTVGFLAPREMFSTEAVSLGSVLPSGTQPVVVRLIWQGSHGLAWLALGQSVSTVSPTPAQLLSATSGQGWNWTSLLLYTDSVDAYFLPGDYATLTFALPISPPAGTSYVVITNGAPWTTPSGSPHAAFTFSPSVPVNNRTVNFTSLAYDNGSAIVSQLWSFGDGNVSSGNSTAHAYARPGLYNVTLNATDAAGVSARSSRWVLVYPLWDWQSPQPAWGQGNLCTVHTSGSLLSCQNSRSHQCSPALTYNFSGSNLSFALSLTGSSDCLALNFHGSNDVIYLNLSGSNWPYVDVALAGTHDAVRLDLSGSGSSLALALYSLDNDYDLVASGSHDSVLTYLVSADLPADAAPAGHDARNDSVSLSASGSDDQQNITWVDFPGKVTGPNSTSLPGSGRQNVVNWANVSYFPASWAVPENSSSCQQGYGQGCCGSQGEPLGRGGGGGGGGHNCCGWEGQPLGGGWGPGGNCCGGHEPLGGSNDRCCWPWWGGDVGMSPSHCCWVPAGSSGPSAPDHGCHDLPSTTVPSSIMTGPVSPLRGPPLSCAGLAEQQAREGSSLAPAGEILGFGRTGAELPSRGQALLASVEPLRLAG